VHVLVFEVPKAPVPQVADGVGPTVGHIGRRGRPPLAALGWRREGQLVLLVLVDTARGHEDAVLHDGHTPTVEPDFPAGPVGRAHGK